MRLPANENFPGPVVRELRRLGHDIAWVKEDAPGSKDHEVLARAMAEGRILATLDKDFGELAYRSRLPAECGIVLVRLRPSAIDLDNSRMVRAILGHEHFQGSFVVIEEDRVRVRPLGAG